MNSPKATWWVQSSPGVNYWRADLPARHLPGLTLSIIGDPYRWQYTDRAGVARTVGQQPQQPDLARHPSGVGVVFPRQRGQCAIWMAPGNGVRAILMAEQQEQGYRVLVEVDDNYLVAPAVDFGAWKKRLNREGEHSFEAHRKIVPWADGVICATPRLADVYRAYNPNVFVCPNQVDPDDWPDDPPHQPDGVLRVGYAGSDSHMFDVRLAYRALSWAAQQPDVEIVIAGIGIVRDFPFKHRRLEWSDTLADYRRNLEQIDVMLCPLKPGVWSDCKSDVKVLEAAMGGACSVVSRTEPYRPWFDGPAMVADNEKGFLKAVKHLVSNRDEARQMANAAREKVMDERTVAGNVWRWQEAVETDVAVAA